MKIHVLSIIIFSITSATFQTHAMDATLSQHFLAIAMGQTLFFNNQSHYQPFSHHKIHYRNQILPNDVLDKIIAYCPHNTRKNLKEVCTQLAFLTSINRLNKFIIHDFIIGDEKEKAAFFTTLIKTSKPHLITTIIKYAEQKAKTYNFMPEDVVCITPEDAMFITLEPEQEYIQKHYLNPLLEEALHQDNDRMIHKLTENDPNNPLLEEYYEKLCKKRIRMGWRIARYACAMPIALATIAGFFTVVAFAIIDCSNTTRGCGGGLLNSYNNLPLSNFVQNH